MFRAFLWQVCGVARADDPLLSLARFAATPLGAAAWRGEVSCVGDTDVSDLLTAWAQSPSGTRLQRGGGWVSQLIPTVLPKSPQSLYFTCSLAP